MRTGKCLDAKKLLISVGFLLLYVPVHGFITQHTRLSPFSQSLNPKIIDKINRDKSKFAPRVYLPLDTWKLHTLSTENEDSEPEANTALFLKVLLPLLLVYISNQWSRSSLYYLVNFSDDAIPNTAMNVDIGFSQAQYGLLASIAFTTLFAVTSLIAGNLADRYDRKVLTIASCLAWTAATLGTGLASSYEEVTSLRILMGLGMGFTTPAAYTLIRDLFPKSNAGLASSIYGSGVYFGGALASLTILLDLNFGWRETMFLIAAYGVSVAGLTGYSLPNDPSNDGYANNNDDSPEVTKSDDSFVESASAVLSSTSVQWLYVASFFRFCSGLSIGVWGASYFKLTFPNDASSYSIINAVIVGVCGAVSGIIGGAASDWIALKAADKGFSQNVGRLLVPIAGTLLSIPAWYYCVNAETFNASMICLAIEYLVAECWFGPVIATLQSSVGNKGGTAQGLFTLTGAFANLAPSALGSIYGSMSGVGGSDSSSTLSSLLSSFVGFGYLISAICFIICASSINQGAEQEAS